MELKCLWTHYTALHYSSYQSYQSGIEIWIHDAGCWLRDSLSIVPKWNWNRQMTSRFSSVCHTYQSYQSGIEINKSEVHPLQPFLSIVPKWNWNTTKGSRSPLISASYQSYQSGIEIYYSGLRSIRPCLSIVPKWNWNAKSVTKLSSTKQTINRTKVELK